MACRVRREASCSGAVFEDFAVDETRQTLGRTITEADIVAHAGLRFVKPVFVGDTIRAKSTIKEKRGHPRRATHGVVERAGLTSCVSCGQRNRILMKAGHRVARH